MTARHFRLGALLLLLPLLLTACKGENGPIKNIPKPTPTPAPDADAIVYVHHGQLWMMKWDGSNAGILISSRKNSFWFPNGSPLGDDVLAWMSRPDGTMDVVRVGLDGRYSVLTSIGETALPPMENSRLGNAPSYNSKGDRIAYSFNGNIWLIDRDGENAETLISDGQSYSPVWSPDDKEIAYVNGHAGHYDLWVTMVDSHDTWQVTDFQDYSVGEPCWVAGGKSIMITRIQQDESDLVEVLADTDVPLVDADVLTKDHNSASGHLNKEGKYLAYASAGAQDPNAPSDAPPPLWDIWTADAAVKQAKKTSMNGGNNPIWIRPSVPSAVLPQPLATMPPPTPVSAQLPPAPQHPQVNMPSALPKPTMFAAAPTPAWSNSVSNPLPTPATPRPTPMPNTVSVPPMAKATPAPASAAPSTQKSPQPLAAVPTHAAASAPPAPAQQGKAAPTQPPAKAAALRMRMRVRFDPDTEVLDLSSLSDMPTFARRVKQYAYQSITVYGPLDRSPLRGRYASEDERSQARATQVADQLAKAADIQSSVISAQPYAPTVVGATQNNGIEIRLELKP